jgi:hypothetical protein
MRRAALSQQKVAEDPISSRVFTYAGIATQSSILLQPDRHEIKYNLKAASAKFFGDLTI